MQRMIVLGLGFVAAIILWNNVYAQSHFTLTAWSVSITEPVVGVMQDGPYTLTSGFMAFPPPSESHQIYLPIVTR